MLNNNDINNMKKDVMSMIGDWNRLMQIWNMKVSGSQTSWNPYMNEVTGDPVYFKVYNVPVDVVSSRGEPYVEPSVAGPKYKGKCQLHIPVDHYTESKVGSVPTTYIYLPSYICEKYGTYSIDGSSLETPSVSQSIPIAITDDTIFIIDGNTNEKWVMNKISHKVGEILIDVIIRSGE